jgi:hypothetical protein
MARWRSRAQRQSRLFRSIVAGNCHRVRWPAASCGWAEPASRCGWR